MCLNKKLIKLLLTYKKTVKLAPRKDIHKVLSCLNLLLAVELLWGIAYAQYPARFLSA